MAFDGLHIIWTTQRFCQPHEAGGDWSPLHELYKQLSSNGHYYRLSAAISESASRATTGATTKAITKTKATPNATIALSLREQNEVEQHLSTLTAPDGDRIAGGLPLACCAINTTSVQLLFVPALPVHSQIIGRLKSQTSSWLLRQPEREGQKQIWSRSYWFANLNGAEAIAKVERFIHQQHGSESTS